MFHPPLPFVELVEPTPPSIPPCKQVDDPIDAFAVHGAAGAWGVLAAALFDWGDHMEPGRWSNVGPRLRW